MMNADGYFVVTLLMNAQKLPMHLSRVTKSKLELMRKRYQPFLIHPRTSRHVIRSTTIRSGNARASVILIASLSSK